MNYRETLKHFFVPHEGNDYKPHFFRKLSLGIFSTVLVVLLAISATSSVVTTKTGLGASVLSLVLIDLTNQNRISNNEAPLIKNDLLETAAKLKATDMATKGYFAHTSPEGLTPWHWFQKAGYNFMYAGENLAIDFTESADVENAWLASPTHRANILNGKFREIGIATYDGTYQGRQTTFVVQSFGTPIPVAETVTTTPTPTASRPATATTAKPAPLPAKIATAPAVKGATVEETKEAKIETETLAESDRFVAVRNIAVTAVAEAAEVTPATSNQGTQDIQKPEQYSTWYQRMLVYAPNSITIAYIVFGAIVLVLLGIFIFIEIKRQHPKNIAYGFLVVGLLVALIYVNRHLFVLHLM